MDISTLQKDFRRIGAHLEVSIKPSFRGLTDPDHSYVLDIIEKPRSEYYELILAKENPQALDLYSVNVKPKDRHLLLQAKTRRLDNPHRWDKEKLLCGHDERHWFVAPLANGSVVNVDEAMTSLKPRRVRTFQQMQRVKRKNLHKRRNDGFVRQGEWFFVPTPNFEPDMPFMILKNEPLMRGAGSKPHIVEEVFRHGGQTVYVSWKYPTGIPGDRYRKLLLKNPDLKKLNWQIMRRDPVVYARGKVRHKDHKTIRLPFWHRVQMANEKQSRFVAFLD